MVLKFCSFYGFKIFQFFWLSMGLGPLIHLTYVGPYQIIFQIDERPQKHFSQSLLYTTAKLLLVGFYINHFRYIQNELIVGFDLLNSGIDYLRSN